MRSRQQGFSIIELVITIAIFLVLIAAGAAVAPKLKSIADEAATQQALDDVVSNVVKGYSTKLTYDGLSRSLATSNGWYPPNAQGGLALNGQSMHLELTPVDLYGEGRNTAFRVTFPANTVTQFQCRNFLQSQVARARGIWGNGGIVQGPMRYTTTLMGTQSRVFCDPLIHNIIATEWGVIIAGN